MSTKTLRNKKCGACSEELITQEQLKCITCSLKYHYDCINTSSKKYKELSTDFKNNWVCPTCRAKQAKCDNSDTPVRSFGISPRDTSSNITLRRTQPTHLTQSQESLTLESIKHIIHDEMNEFINKIESNISKMIENKIKGLTVEITNLNESVLFITNQYEDLKKDMQVKFKDVKQLKEENDCLKSTVKNLNSRLSHHYGAAFKNEQPRDTMCYGT
ncbi:unnamed protein product [Parnassius apollo]|uniref:(apollo) hypothetical protein n=1 Tax=Parnassius apollo TaxID=110799 RepID=A0A8S3WHY1_PARAO|nr:unnamed protein product [Parnassius apollo]